MITKLTKKQEKLLEVVRDEWIQRAIGGDTSVNIEILTESIHWIYSLADLNPPEVVVLDSPYACQVKANNLLWPDEKSMRPVSMGYYSGLGWDSGWTAYYDYMHRIGVEVPENFLKWLRFVRDSGCWDMVKLDTHALVCRRPKKVVRDDQNRLHNMTGPAMLWEDGYAQYFLHGMGVDKDWVENPSSITVERVMNQTNQELRRAMIQLMGMERFVKEAGAKVVDEWVDGGNQLCSILRLDFSDDEPIVVYKWRCPSTGKVGLLRINPSINNCHEAVARSFNMSAAEYKTLMET